MCACTLHTHVRSIINLQWSREMLWPVICPRLPRGKCPKKRSNMWHDQGKWVPCRNISILSFSCPLFISFRVLWCKKLMMQNNMKQKNWNTVFAISKTISPTSDSFLLIMSHYVLNPTHLRYQSIVKLICFILVIPVPSLDRRLEDFARKRQCQDNSKNLVMSNPIRTVLSLLSAQGTYGSHFMWALIEMLKNSAKDRYFCKITQYVPGGLVFNGLWS